MQPENPTPQSNPNANTQPPVYLSPNLPPEQPKAKKEGMSSIFSTIGILIAAPIIAIFLTTYVFQSYEVDGPSMETTLQNRDRLLVLKVPKTIAKITGGDYIPKRDEIIIFKTNAIQDGTLNDGSEKQLVKRVVGLPGDRVVVKDGTMTIYNSEHPNGYNPDEGVDVGEYAAVTPGDVDITVGEGEVFVSGDNRTNSVDSRTIGTVPAEDIIGELIFRIYPLGEARKF